MRRTVIYSRKATGRNNSHTRVRVNRLESSICSLLVKRPDPTVCLHRSKIDIKSVITGGGRQVGDGVKREDD